MIFYDEEIAKIDKYTEDKLYRVEKDLKDVKDRIKTLMREERQAPTIAAKAAIQEEIAELERKKRRLRQNIFDAEDEIESERKALIAKLKNGMKSTITVKELFTFKWNLV
jgi:phosphoglycerate-specific signal transduction histidine kinase